MNDETNDTSRYDALKGLPISQTLMQRIEKLTRDGEIAADDAVAPIIGAIADLERLIRKIGS